MNQIVAKEADKAGGVEWPAGTALRIDEFLSARDLTLCRDALPTVKRGVDRKGGCGAQIRTPRPGDWVV
jgi:hypothetical protein